MTLNNKKWEGVSPYETPAVKTLEVMSEGVLCGSNYHLGGGGVYGDEDIYDNGEY